MSQKAKIETILREGYQLDIGDVLNKSFEIYKKTWKVTAAGLLIVGFFVLITIFIFMAFGINSNFFDFQNGDITSIENLGQSESSFLVFSLLGIIYQVLLAPLTAGFIKICKNAKENSTIGLNVVFSFFQSKHLVNLIIAGILIAVLNGLISYINQFIIGYPSLNYLSNMFFITISVFMVPLIIFKDFGIMEAFEYSVKLSFKKFIFILIIMLLTTIIGYLGALACGIGVLFTLPIIYAAQFCIYDEIIGDNEVSEIDMIGNTDY